MLSHQQEHSDPLTSSPAYVPRSRGELREKANTVRLRTVSGTRDLKATRSLEQSLPRPATPIRSCRKPGRLARPVPGGATGQGGLRVGRQASGSTPREACAHSAPESSRLKQRRPCRPCLGPRGRNHGTHHTVDRRLVAPQKITQKHQLERGSS